MRPSWNGKPLRVEASASTSTGLVNLRTIARSSRLIVLRAKTPPSVISSWVTASASTPMPISFGFMDTWETKLMVIPLRRSPARLPTTYSP